MDACGWTERKIKRVAIEPDEVYKDALIGGKAVGHHNHSYKQGPDQEKGPGIYWKDGDALEMMKAHLAIAHNFRQCGQDRYDLVCYLLVLATHYAVDANTYPHLVFHGVPGQEWTAHHIPWEVKMAHWLERHEDMIGPVTFTPYKNVYSAFVANARWAYFQAFKVDGILRAGHDMTDEDKIGLATHIAEMTGSMLLTATQDYWPKE